MGTMTETNSNTASQDVVSTLHAARLAAIAELELCEHRAAAIREELGMVEAKETVVHLNGTHETTLVDDGDLKPRSKAGRPAKARVAKAAKASAKKSSGRLARRTPEQIKEALSKIVSLVKKAKTGMRAEDIRKELDLLPKEMPRLLKEGLKTKALKSKGEKRATVYSAA